MRGQCTCGQVSYRLTDTPMIVHCCHCSWCQRESGSAFALNIMIERECVEVTGKTVAVNTPSASGKGQIIHRCPDCHVGLWSHYAGGGEAIAFVRVGTLDAPDKVEPDLHIFTSTKLPWVVLPEGARAFEEYYNPKVEWPEAAQARYKATRK